jgi:hypothetical protein
VPGFSDMGAVSLTTLALRVQRRWREYSPERVVRSCVMKGC